MLKIQEKILLHQISRGNQAAFTRLYNEYWKKIYQFIYFKISDQDKVQELTNEVFIKIFDFLKSKKTKIKNFRAFLYQTAKNLVIDFYRESNQKEVSLDESIKEDFYQEKDLSEEIDLKINLEKIKEGLKQLPDNYREVLVLRFINDLKFKEIAKITGQTPANVRQLVHRGLKMLRKKLTSLK